jgi:hypothetical protein
MAFSELFNSIGLFIHGTNDLELLHMEKNWKLSRTKKYISKSYHAFYG